MALVEALRGGQIGQLWLLICGQVLTSHIKLEHAAVSVDPARLVEFHLGRLERRDRITLILMVVSLLFTVRRGLDGQSEARKVDGIIDDSLGGVIVGRWCLLLLADHERGTVAHRGVLVGAALAAFEFLDLHEGRRRYTLESGRALTSLEEIWE